MTHRRKALSQPSVLLWVSINSHQSVNRHNDSTGLRFTRVYYNTRMTVDIFCQIPFVTSPIQIGVCKVSVR